MTNNDALYRQEVLRRANNLKHTGSITDSKSLQATNPLCGDEQELDIKLDGNTVQAASFRPQGCLVSKVSTDLLLDLIIGKDIGFIEQLDLDNIVELLHTPLTSSRQKCAMLGLSTIQDYLKSL